MSRNKICKSTIVAVMVAGALMLTACGGASVPDKYNYDDFSKYVKLGKYKNLEYTKADASVSDTEVQDCLLYTSDAADE